MSDDKDDSTRAGVVVIAAVTALVVIGTLFGVVMRSMSHKGAAPAVTTAAVEEALIEGPLSGALVGAVFFESGKATVDGAPPVLADAVKQLKDHADKSAVLAGFHDATGDPAKNAELAKDRAKAVRAALVQEGIEASRVRLRKPEQTDGGADLQAARRVEIRLVDAQ